MERKVKQQENSHDLVFENVFFYEKEEKRERKKSEFFFSFGVFFFFFSFRVGLDPSSLSKPQREGKNQTKKRNLTCPTVSE